LRTLAQLSDLPAHGVFDGELVAFADGKPHFPLVCDRLLHGDTSVQLTYVIFDVLELEGEPTVAKPYRERRKLLDGLSLGAGPWFVAEAFGDGHALFAAVCDQGLEGVVAKRRSERYRPGERRWVKTKNKEYWRYADELESVRRSIEASCGRAVFPRVPTPSLSAAATAESRVRRRRTRAPDKSQALR
jgi:ATP-dependent DNA ligase